MILVVKLPLPYANKHLFFCSDPNLNSQSGSYLFECSVRRRIFFWWSYIRRAQSARRTLYWGLVIRRNIYCIYGVSSGHIQQYGPSTSDIFRPRPSASDEKYPRFQGHIVLCGPRRPHTYNIYYIYGGSSG